MTFKSFNNMSVIAYIVIPESWCHVRDWKLAVIKLPEKVRLVQPHFCALLFLAPTCNKGLIVSKCFDYTNTEYIFWNAPYMIKMMLQNSNEKLKTKAHLESSCACLLSDSWWGGHARPAGCLSLYLSVNTGIVQGKRELAMNLHSVTSALSTAGK